MENIHKTKEVDDGYLVYIEREKGPIIRIATFHHILVPKAKYGANTKRRAEAHAEYYNSMWNKAGEGNHDTR